MIEEDRDWGDGVEEPLITITLKGVLYLLTIGEKKKPYAPFRF